MRDTMRTRSLRTLSIGLLVVIGVAACSSGPTDAQARAIGKTSLSGSEMKVSSAVEMCIGKSMVDDLGLATAQKAAKQKDFAKLPKAQRTAAIAALDKCVPSGAFAATFASQVSGGTAGSKALTACLTKQFKGKVGSVVESFNDPNGDASTRKLLDKCPTGDLANQLLTAALQQGKVPDATIQCALQKVPDVKMSDVLGQSKDLETKLEAAVNDCTTGK